MKQDSHSKTSRIIILKKKRVSQENETGTQRHARAVSIGTRSATGEAWKMSWMWKKQSRFFTALSYLHQEHSKKNNSATMNCWQECGKWTFTQAKQEDKLVQHFGQRFLQPAEQRRSEVAAPPLRMQPRETKHSSEQIINSSLFIFIRCNGITVH